MRKLLFVILGITIVASPLVSAAPPKPDRKPRKQATPILTETSRFTDRSILSARLRIGDELMALPGALDLAPVQDQGGAVPAHPCSIETIVGAWAWISRGNDPGGAPFAGVGIYNVDEDGNSTFSGMISGGGWSFSPPPGSATLTVNPDCTGTETKNDGSTSFFVVLRNGKEIWGVPTSPGFFNYVVMKRISGGL